LLWIEYDPYGFHMTFVIFIGGRRQIAARVAGYDGNHAWNRFKIMLRAPKAATGKNRLLRGARNRWRCRRG
jgi:hypothetical protein